jgi:hypothetical protein
MAQIGMIDGTPEPHRIRQTQVFGEGTQALLLHSTADDIEAEAPGRELLECMK